MIHTLSVLFLVHGWLPGKQKPPAQTRFVTEFWANRHEADFTPTITAPAPGNDLAQAQDLMRQLGLTGEVEWTRSRADSAHLEFRVSRPGRIVAVKADLAGPAQGIAEVRIRPLIPNPSGIRAPSICWRRASW